MGLWSKMFIGKKYLPRDIIYNCIEVYENNDIFLKKIYVIMKKNKSYTNQKLVVQSLKNL